MGIAIEFVLFHGFHVEISWIKGGPGQHSGGWGPGQSGAPWGPGGECFAPPSQNDENQSESAYVDSYDFIRVTSAFLVSDADAL